ncbi:MAG: TonB-dependent receptor [Alphaproteobacteria bacterium]|nr:TonB-dependent receptor [Alphaproteobacteria bacterium]MDE2265365.1 TonB-dependent receptor [Alphaproteobacteria bacterium]
MMLGASVVALVTVMGAGAAFAQDAGGSMETVVVTGFKASLEKALDLKRNALDSSDSILAEDIAKFPDLNLSESLQRIPGVALERQQGEGREISVRGLSADFTRVRINGMEALATAGSSSVAGVNRGRSFDFNIFASDLFSAITVHKSASADLEEGSLGATVDLHTGHPFDHPGFVFTTNAQYGYNDLDGGSNPRVAALVSDTFMGGRLGVLVSGAYGIRNTLEEGYSTVRFTNDNTPQNATHSSPSVGGCSSTTTGTSAGSPVLVNGQSDTCSQAQRFLSVNGLSNPATPAGGTATTYDTVNEAFYPRFPRYDLITNHEKRLGLTGSVQWQPDDNTLITVDGLFADYAMVRNEEYLEANSFANNFRTKALGGSGTPTSLGLGNIAVTGYTLDTTHNNLTTLTANGVGLRAEHFLTDIDSRFMQTTVDGSHTFSDDFKVHGLVGWSESHMREPLETTLTYDYNGGLVAGSTTNYAGVTGYSYDFSGGYDAIPMLNYGSATNGSGAVTSLNNWFISQMRERSEANYNSYRSAAGDFEYDFSKTFTFTGGVDYKAFGYRTVSMQRTNGTTANQDFVIPSDIRAADLSQYSMAVNLHGISVPTGATTTWLIPDLTKFNKAFDIWSPTAENGAFQQGIQPALSSNGAVHEDDLGFWLQAAWDTEFYGVPFRGNIGGRYIETSSESVGYAYDSVAKAVVPADVKQSYHNFLPALNAVFEPTDNFLIRINAAQTMARPSLTNMLPGASVSISGANRNVSVGNPGLKPYTSKNVDLGFEWYYHKGAMLSIAMFYKHIDTLVQSIAQDIVYSGNPFGLPNSLAVAACGTAYAPPPASGCNEAAIWHFTTPVNTKGSPLYGTEINWQQPFDFLPDPLSNFGFLGNVTFVQARQYYYNSNGTVNTFADLSGLSHTSYNTTLYYDDGTLQARISAAFRSKYIASINPGNQNDQLITAPTFNLDWSSSYKWDDNFTLSFEAVNLTNQGQVQYTDSIGQRPYVNHVTGREFFLGIRYNY